jgi:hypothetical protein
MSKLAASLRYSLILLFSFGSQAMQASSSSKNSLAGGTLVVMVPTAAGLVIAADSRLTVGGTDLFCDGSFKITELENVDSTALVVTGTSTVRDTRSLQGILLSEFCEQLYKIVPKFDANSILKGIIEAEPALAGGSFDLPQASVDAVNEFLRQEPHSFDALFGQNIFQVALASYDAAEKISLIRSFHVDLSQDGTVTASHVKVERHRSTDKASLSLFGEANYLTSQVFSGPGLRFLGERYARFKNTGPDAEIREIDALVGADFATDLIEAAEKTSTFVKPNTGIGGPVDVLLLGGDRRQQRLRWKS